jgi:erythromycin esterase
VIRQRRFRDGEATATTGLLATIRSISRPLSSPADLDSLLDRIGEARYVLLGEATHGTHEFYTWRSAISQRLIEEKGFSFLAVEGDWPDCYRVNRFIKGYPDAGDNAREVLRNFERWPTWMWANEEVLDLTEWLRQRNDTLPESSRVGFYGLDVYSLWDSLDQILNYLGSDGDEGVEAARSAFRCFEPYGEEVEQYARATRWVDASCEDEVVKLLSALRRRPHPFPRDPEAHFNAIQNAWVLRNAERYYRTMIAGGPESWNVRDRHMAACLERLMRHHGPTAKAIVWEHNTHIGDARYTDMADDGMVNVGQLAREAHGEGDVVLVGFGTHHGSVIAGEGWDAPMKPMTVPPARHDSWEDLLHRAGEADRLLLLDSVRQDEGFLEERGHRAIGVVYHPEREHLGNYVPTVLPRRYDAFLFVNETRALEPLAEVEPHEEGEVPETFPFGV